MLCRDKTVVRLWTAWFKTDILRQNSWKNLSLWCKFFPEKYVQLRWSWNEEKKMQWASSMAYIKLRLKVSTKLPFQMCTSQNTSIWVSVGSGWLVISRDLFWECSTLLLCVSYIRPEHFNRRRYMTSCWVFITYIDMSKGRATQSDKMSWMIWNRLQT